jgi:hypothetical protein
MDVKKFDALLKGNNAINITDDICIFNDYELYNYKTYESRQYDNLTDLLSDNPDVKKIIENTDMFYNEFNGGRGASSSSMGGGFTSAGGGGNGKDERLLNATLNLGTSKGNSVDSVLSRFKNKYGKSDREYGIAVDQNGYVHEHIKGGKSSVGVAGGKGMTVIHNHPSGGAFSKADLKVFGSTNNHGIIATSSNTSKKSTYRIEKTSHFDAKGFLKAVNKAKWPSNYSYDKGADWWLKKNASKYGYKYSASGVPKK